MNYYHVDNGTIIKRLRKSPVKESLYATEAELLAELASRDVYPEKVIEPTLEPWERTGARTETFNDPEQRVDVTWAVNTVPLSDYKSGLIRRVIQQGIASAEYDTREVCWALADFSIQSFTLPTAYRNAVATAEQALVDSIAGKVQNIRQAATHADAKAAYDAA